MQNIIDQVINKTHLSHHMDLNNTDIDLYF